MVLVLVVASMALFLYFAGGVSLLVNSRRRSRHIPPPPKILTPLDDPMGPVLELIQWAEGRAIAEHKAAFSDPVTEELERRWRQEYAKGKVTVLEDFSFRTANEHRERMGFENIETGYIRMAAGDYGRYLDGIGYITADTKEKLDRACEIVLRQKFEEAERRIRSLDARIHGTLASPDMIQSWKQERQRAWETAKDAIARMEAMQDAMGDPVPIKDNVAHNLLMGQFFGTEPEVRRDSHWVMDVSWFTRMRQLNDANSRPFWTPAVAIDRPDYLMGLPVTIAPSPSLPHLEPNARQ